MREMPDRGVRLIHPAVLPAEVTALVALFTVVCRDICKQRSSSLRRRLDETCAVLRHLRVSLSRENNVSIACLKSSQSYLWDPLEHEGVQDRACMS